MLGAIFVDCEQPGLEDEDVVARLDRQQIDAAFDEGRDLLVVAINEIVIRQGPRPLSDAIGLHVEDLVGRSDAPRNKAWLVRIAACVFIRRAARELGGLDVDLVNETVKRAMPELSQFLLDHGAPLEVRDREGFTLLMHGEAQGVIEEGDRVVGVRAVVDGRPEEIRSDLVVGADGRHSTVRAALGLKVTPSAANFVLIHFPLDKGKTAADADTFLTRRGLVLRALNNYRLPHALRMTIGTDEANRLVVEGLRDFMAG